MSFSIPILETARLRLRDHRLADFDNCAAMWGDPEMVRYISGTPSTKQQSWSRMRSYLGHWAVLGYGYWAVEDKATGAYIGDIGFADFKRELAPSIQGVPELGWLIARNAQGQGYATEALRAAILWGDAEFPGPRTVCLIDPENHPSLRVAEKCGFREVTRTTYDDKPTVLFERIRGRRI